jgi:DNA polymerase III subunit chi
LTHGSSAGGPGEIGFYHLTRTGPEQALPQLLGRTLAAGQRAVVLCPSAERVAALDAALWQCTDPDWLPHGTAADGDADLQPIWLTTEDAAPNGARFMFLIDGAQSMRLAEYDRVFDLFDGNDDAAVAAARERWTAAKAAGHALTYWQQGPRGWEKKV